MKSNPINRDFRRFWRFLLPISWPVLLSSAPALATQWPVTAPQQAIARQVAEAGVPLEELKPQAPDEYRVKRGDTLWDIAGLYLRSPWSWPQLWGMNLQQIRNPHLIYPGQRLLLLRRNGRALLQVADELGRGTAGVEPADDASLPTVKLSPRQRVQMLATGALPTLRGNQIEPFISESMIVDEPTLNQAPRLVAAAEGRVLLGRGDRVYARGGTQPMQLDPEGNAWRVFRQAIPLRDPADGQVLGYEVRYLGQAQLRRSELPAQPAQADQAARDAVPATLDIVAAREEIRVGDRLLPQPERELLSYVPHAPQQPIDARIVAVHGDAVSFSAQNQVVIINKGQADGLEPGHVLALLKRGQKIVDRTDPDRPTIQLPDERNGLLMVFRPFEHLSYGLILEITDAVRVGDRLVPPR